MFIVFGNLAANAVAFGIYVMTAIDPNYNSEDRGPIIGLAIAVLTICAVINVFSREGGIWINNALAVGKIAVLVTITILGFVYAGGKLKTSAIDNPSVAANNATSDNFNQGTSFLVQSEPAGNYFGDIVHSFFYVIAPYAGFKQPFYVLSEVARPRRVFPKVTISTMLMLWVLYMLVNVSYLCVVPHEIYTLSRTTKIDITSAFFNYIFNPGGGPGTVKRIMAAVIAVSIFGNLMIHTFSAGRLKQEIAKEGIIPFSLFFATGHETPGAKLLAYARRDRGPRAIVDMENHLEQTPTSAIWLHWTTAVILVAVTAILPPNQQYMFLVYLYVYINQVIIGTLVAGGLLYLKLDSFFNGKKGRAWAHKVAWKPWIDPLHAVVYFLVMGFLLFASLARPSANSPFDQSVTGYVWWVVPMIGLSSLLFGVVWWCGLQILQWKGRWRLTVRRTPYIVQDEDGNYVQKVELVNQQRLVNVRYRGNHDDKVIEMT
jgi:amino acid transporter